MKPTDVARVACPLCERSACETTATAVWVRGFLIMYQISHRQLVGCVRCVRQALFAEAGKSLLLGWFSVTAVIINPFLILYNLIRGLTISPNPKSVAAKLQELGVKPPSQGTDLLQVVYALTATLITADGKIDPEEILVATELGQQLFDDFNPARLTEACNRPQELPAAKDLGSMLREVLSDEQKAILFNYMMEIAQADGVVSPDEGKQLLAIATGMEFDINQVPQSQPDNGHSVPS